jgi:hypothetical protein
VGARAVGEIEAAGEKSEDAVLVQALAHFKAGRLDEAARLYGGVVQRDPERAGAWHNLGVTLRRLERFPAAVACFRRALELRPQDPSTLSSLGNVLKDLDRMDEALISHQAAVAAKPRDAGLRHNYGITLREAGYFEEALDELDQACQLGSHPAEMRWDRAITTLHLGRFPEGWQAFEVRWEIGELPPSPHSQPRWRGEDYDGKTLLVTVEQGFGDAILAARYLPLVKARGGNLILECKPPLRRLFQTTEGADRLVEPGAKDEDFDLQVPMMSLPGIFETDLASVPPATRFSVDGPPPPQIGALLERAAGRFKVGIVWSGSVTFKGNRQRAVALERFLPLAECPGVQLYSLQKGPRAEELETSRAGGVVWDLGGGLEDFHHTAATLQGLDLVIMTDSAVAHLAGSLNRPVWNLLCYVPYWLYLWEREDTPWYPSMRLFRQPRPGDWEAVFARVREELERAVEMKREGRWPPASAVPI